LKERGKKRGWLNRTEKKSGTSRRGKKKTAVKKRGCTMSPFKKEKETNGGKHGIVKAARKKSVMRRGG